MNDNTLIKKILTKMPLNIKPVEYLMDALSLGRGAVYRIIKGKRGLTLSEGIKLSSALGFSLDEIANSNNENRVIFDLFRNISSNTEKNYLKALNYYEDYLDRRFKAEKFEITVTMNRLLMLTVLSFDNLLKFNYYKSLRLTNEIPPEYTFSQITVPNRLMELCHRLAVQKQRISKYTYIMDKDVFKNSVKDIQYYYKRKLISDEEIILLKKDLEGAVDLIKKLAQSGYNDIRSSFNHYISAKDIEANTAYNIYDNDYHESMFWTYSIIPFGVTQHEGACAIHKQWIDAIIRNSTLITVQTKCFRKNILTDNVNM